MRAKERLWRIKESRYLMQTFREEIAELENRAVDVTVKYKDVNVKSTVSNTQENTYIEIIDLISKIQKHLRYLTEQEAKALKIIKTIGNPKHQDVLINYYILNKTLEQTAVDMDITYRWVCKLRDDALVEFEKAEKDIHSS